MSTIADKLKTTYLSLAGLTTSIRQLLSVSAKEVTSQEINNKLNGVAQESTSLQIKDKLDNLNVDSEDARMVAQFFGLPAELPEGYEFMTPEEVCSTLEDIMTSMDLALTPQQAQAITQTTLTQQ